MKTKERHFGDWLKERREERNLSISELAQRLPGTSKKWIRKIQDWETGASLPKTRQKNTFCTALGISKKEWKRVHKEFFTPTPSHRDPETISETNRKLIAQYIHILMAHQDKILENPEWNHIPLNGFHVGLMYFGGAVTMTLGSLLSCWSQGYLIASGPRQFYILSGGGSPLAGCRTFMDLNMGPPQSKNETMYFVLFIPQSSLLFDLSSSTKPGSLHGAWHSSWLILGFPFPKPKYK